MAVGQSLLAWLGLRDKRNVPKYGAFDPQPITMKRLFGIGADKAPTKSLDEVSETMDARSAHIDTKVKAIDHELLELKKQMAATKGPGLQRLKQRAMMLLKQRKVLDSQCVNLPHVVVAALYSLCLCPCRHLPFFASVFRRCASGTASCSSSRSTYSK